MIGVDVVLERASRRRIRLDRLLNRRINLVDTSPAADHQRCAEGRRERLQHRRHHLISEDVDEDALAALDELVVRREEVRRFFFVFRQDRSWNPLVS